MATVPVPLPDQPSFEQLKKQARDLQRAVRSGAPDALALVAEHHPRGAPEAPDRARFPLSAAQLVVARRHGFAGWPRLKAHFDVVERYMRVPKLVEPTTDPATEFLRLACLTYEDDGPQRWEQASRVLSEHPEIAHANIYTAAVVADATHVRRVLASDPEQARTEGGPYAWEPLFYLAYARHDREIDEAAVLDTAAGLLEHGADPNAGYLWHGLPTPFTVLTGVFGEGEAGPRRQPRHPHAPALARLLLDAGADPNDGQALYNRMFERGNDHLELLFEFGLGSGDGGPWRARLRDAIASPAELVHRQLEWAVDHDMAARVALLVEHGADVNAPFADGRTPYESAARNGNTEVVEYLAASGATVPSAPVTSVDGFVGAVLAADRAEVERLRAAAPDLLEKVRGERPALMVWAAATDRPAAIALLAELGFDVNAMGRGDVPVEEPWETALHQAVARGDRSMAELLLSLGADADVHDVRFDATPLGWARYFEQPSLEELLEPVTSP